MIASSETLLTDLAGIARHAKTRRLGYYRCFEEHGRILPASGIKDLKGAWQWLLPTLMIAKACKSLLISVIWRICCFQDVIQMTWSTLMHATACPRRSFCQHCSRRRNTVEAIKTALSSLLTCCYRALVSCRSCAESFLTIKCRATGPFG